VARTFVNGQVGSHHAGQPRAVHQGNFFQLLLIRNYNETGKELVSESKRGESGDMTEVEYSSFVVDELKLLQVTTDKCSVCASY